MHNHDDNNSKMMWVMMIGCGLPILLLLFAGESGGRGWFKWLILGAVSFIAVFHYFGMRHDPSASKTEDKFGETSAPSDTKHHNEPL